MARTNNTDRYPIKTNPNGQDTIIINDSENNGKTVTVTLESVVALALAGGTDTFATLNGNIITFPDGQTVDVTPVVDTDTDTFATLANTVITFSDGQTIDVRQGNAELNGNIITFGDGQTADITPVVDTDTDTFATLSGGTITFPDGQTVTIPSGGTDDQTASEVSLSPITGLISNQVQAGIAELLSLIPQSTSDLTNDGANGANPFIDSATIPSYTIDTQGNILRLLEGGTTVISTVDLSLYLDDTNLSRLVSGTLDGGTGIATFTRDDASTFTVDFSAFLSGATPSLQSVISQDSTLTVNNIISSDDNNLDINFEGTFTDPGGTFKVRSTDFSDDNVESELEVEPSFAQITNRDNATSNFGQVITEFGEARVFSGNNTIGSNILRSDVNGIELQNNDFVDFTNTRRLRLDRTELNYFINNISNFRINSDGLVFADQASNAEIDAASGSVLVPKSWVQANLGGGLTDSSGSFTAIMQDLGGGATYTIGSQNCNFYRVGDLVHISIQLSNVTMTGTPTGRLNIAGLPVASDSFSSLNVLRITGSLLLPDPNVGVIVSPAGIQFTIKDTLVDFLEAVDFPTSGSTGSVILAGTYRADDGT